MLACLLAFEVALLARVAAASVEFVAVDTRLNLAFTPDAAPCRWTVGVFESVRGRSVVCALKGARGKDRKVNRLPSFLFGDGAGGLSLVAGRCTTV